MTTSKFDIFCRVIVMLNIVVVIVAGLLVHENWRKVSLVYASLDKRLGLSDIKYVDEMVKQRVGGFWANPDVINLDIKHIDYQQLEYQRQNAEAGRRNFEYISAKISSNGIGYKAKLRLKGDRKIHYENLSNASFRVKIKGGETFRGMKMFSLHKPRARNYIHEWIFLKMMKKEGLISPRYEFIELVVNGKSRGVYALEEHYTKHLLENNESREGPIIRFDEDTGVNFLSSNITPYEQEKWLTDSNLPIVEKAIGLLENYRSGKLSFSQVFDINKWAVFFAVADVTSSRHALVSKSLRIYYNPITSKLEPIPFDGHHLSGDFLKMHIAAELGVEEEKNWTFTSDSAWFFNLFNNPITADESFIKEYGRNLNRLSSKKYLNNFFAENRGELNQNLNIINAESNFHDNTFSFGPIPFLYKEDNYFAKSDYIHSSLVPNVEAYLDTAIDEQITIKVINRHKSLALELVGLGCEDQVLSPENTGFIFPENVASSPEVVAFNIREMPLDFKIDLTCLNLFVKTPGVETVKVVAVTPWDKYAIDDIANDLFRQKENIESSILKPVFQGGKWSVGPGNYLVEKTIISDSELVIQGGAKISLFDNASIVVKAAVDLKGTVVSPVEFFGKGGGGLLVIGALGESNIEHTTFDGLSVPATKGVNITGGVTFFESKVNISDSVFKGNHSEDALNIVRTTARLKDVKFIDIFADALDVDFGTLDLQSSTFLNVGNDAIDMSGTVATVTNALINGVGDKALSIGEESVVNASNVGISDAKIGIASKDKSESILERVSMLNVDIAYAAFQKKNEYGPSSMSVSDSRLSQVQTPFLIETGSVLNLNGQKIEGGAEDVGLLFN
jgi:hypothetical protein